ncbi:MAG TPA: tetratricopeptide repeat protein [Steroidobacteraceae bacterium]|nr:tetratricopeptide repeat protein [Steroidobacteraceae bacterium]
MPLSNPLPLLIACCAFLVGCAAGPTLKEEPQAHDPAALTIVAEIALARGDCKTAAESYAEASQYSDARPLARHASAVALACEHVPAAWKAATRWRALAPGDPEAAARYATVAIKLYRITDARSAIVDFTKAQGTPDAAGLTELAGLLLEQSDAPAVLAAMSGALDASAISPDADALLAELALDGNDAQRASRYAQQALERDPKQLGAKRVLARAYVVRGDAPKAIATAREIMRDDATRGAFELAEVLVALDRLEEAHQELERLRSTKASSGEIDRRLALLAYNAGDLKEAQQRFADLATHGEATDAALLYLADIAARDGDPDAALAGYRRLADSSFALEARSKAASILLTRSKRTEAMLLLDDYVSDHPGTEFEARRSEARLLADHGDAETGLKLLSTALELHPKHPAIEYDRAVILERAGRVKESVEVLEKLLQDRPDDPVLLNALGYTLADHRLDLGRAEGLIHKALTTTPDSPAVLDSLGWVRFRQGDAKAAVHELEHAYSLEHDADIAAHWGEALWTSGKHQEARGVWAAAVARAPDAPLLKATMARFLTDAP